MKAQLTRAKVPCLKIPTEPFNARWVARLLLWLLLFTLPAAVQAQFTYTTENGQITITGYSGPSGAVDIPGTINGLPVTRAGEGAFRSESILTSVSIPNSVTSIGYAAFASCTSLTNVTIPSSVSYIGAEAFRACTGLTDVRIPHGVTAIREGTFAGCVSLTSITIPNGVVSIANGNSIWPPGAFSGCANLTNVTIGSSVTSIGYGAFASCTSLITVAIPNNVTSMGSAVFLGCTTLTTVTMGDGVVAIGSGAFGVCTSLTNVTIGTGVTTIGNAAFSGCISLTGVVIPISVTTIEDFAFLDCTSLSEVSFRGNAPSGNGHMFEGADQVTIYYLPGTTGWGATFADRPTALWSLPYPVILSGGPGFGVAANGFGFLISWATNAAVVVESSPSLVTPVWTPVSTNTLTAGTSQFTDPQWTNHPARLYRLVMP